MYQYSPFENQANNYWIHRCLQAASIFICEIGQLSWARSPWGVADVTALKNWQSTSRALKPSSEINPLNTFPPFDRKSCPLRQCMTDHGDPGDPDLDVQTNRVVRLSTGRNKCKCVHFYWDKGETPCRAHETFEEMNAAAEIHTYVKRALQVDHKVLLCMFLKLEETVETV